MFNLEKEMQKTKVAAEVRREISKMISRMMLESDDVPETKKMAIRLVDAAAEVQDILCDVITPETLTSEHLDIDNAKKMCFLLHTTTEQIKAFAVNNPISAEENHNEI